MGTVARSPQYHRRDRAPSGRVAHDRVDQPAHTAGPAAVLLRLQRTIGNQAVGRLLRTLDGAAPAPHAGPVISRAAAGPQPVEIAHQREHDALWSAGLHVSPQSTDWTTLSARLGTVVDKLGVTGAPQGSKEPRYGFTAPVKTADGEKLAVTRVQDADPGTHDSYYLAAREYKNVGDVLGWDIGESPYRGRTYLEVTGAIAAKAKAGEQEHCDDYARAYEISLDKLDELIGDTFVDKQFEGVDADEAKKKARQFLHGMLNANGLGWMDWKQTGWLQKYKDLRAKTKLRDDNHWHDFTKTIERAGDHVVIRLSDSSTQIGKPSSADLVKP